MTLKLVGATAMVMMAAAATFALASGGGGSASEPSMMEKTFQSQCGVDFADFYIPAFQSYGTTQGEAHPVYATGGQEQIGAVVERTITVQGRQVEALPVAVCSH